MRLTRSTVCPAPFIILAILVHLRLLAGLDEAGLRLVVDSRPLWLAEATNWVFRLGYLPLDVALALVWSVAALVARRSLLAALPPLVLILVVGAQVGLRLVVVQPGPEDGYALHRTFASEPAVSALDRTDLLAREAFLAATAPPPASTGQPAPQAVAVQSDRRGAFPSGHASRILFLALLAGAGLRRYGRGKSWVTTRLIPALLLAVAGLVGYSTLYYGYHWPSDVLGGYLLALAAYPVATWLGARAKADRPGIGPIGIPHSSS